MMCIQPFDTDEVLDEVRRSYELFGYGECATNIHESDML
jgi:hypothetical protein